MKIIACQECKRQWDVSRYRAGQKLRCVCNFVMVVPRTHSYSPEVNHCEACGAPRPPESREPCRYCRAVPTFDAARLSLVCPFCMHRTATGSRYCVNCGRAIQPNPLDATTGNLSCPRCSETKLVNRKVGDFAVDECPSCSGLWVRAECFGRIVNQQAERQSREYRGVGVRGQPVRVTIERDRIVYLKCPVCDCHMHRRNFARASGVIIDECKDDGVWLDADELGKIAAFVASGGMAYSRELQALEAPDRTPGGHTPFPPLKTPTTTPFDRVLGVIRALFG